MAEKGKEDSIVSKMLTVGMTTPPVLAAYIDRYSKPALKVLGAIVNIVGPFYMKAGRLGHHLYKVLPVDLFSALTGLGLCFCGGAYCSSIAAVEAFRMCGWEQTKAALMDVAEEAKAIQAANEVDNKRDDDGNGVPDVDEISASELLQRKMMVFALAVKDPTKLNAALGGLYTAWVAVQGTLRIEFARTITLGVSMGEMVMPTALRLGVPLLAALIPPKYHHWIPTIIRNVVRAGAVSIAWRLQVVNSAIQSAMRGGLLFARSMLRWMQSRKIVTTSHEDTYADEVAGYSVAALGFYCQLNWGFGMPFPLDIVMFPFTAIEWYIRWSITN